MSKNEYPRKRYLPYSQSAHPLEGRGYTCTTEVPQAWYSLIDWCREMRAQGYYAQGFATRSRIRDAPFYLAFIKKR